jgi:hypothetical protein
MVDMAQADRTLRCKQARPSGLYTVRKLDGTVLGTELSWSDAFRLTMKNYDEAQMVRTGAKHEA